MTTSVIVMLELPSFGHMTTPTKQFVSRDKNLVGDVIIYIYTLYIYIYIYIYIYYNATAFILKKNTVANFADFIKIVTMFIKQHLKISTKLKQLEFMY